MVDDDHMGSDVGALAGPAQAASLSSSSPQSLRLRQWKGHHQRILSEDEAETACMLGSKGISTQQVAEILGCRPYTIRRLFCSRPGKARIAELKGFLLKVETEHQFGLAQMLPKARKVLTGAMDTGNTKERSQVAQWLHEVVIPKQVQKTEVSFRGRLEHDISPVIQQMGEQMQALRKAREKDALDRRIEVGSEKLVRMLPESTEG